MDGNPPLGGVVVRCEVVPLSGVVILVEFQLTVLRRSVAGSFHVP